MEKEKLLQPIYINENDHRDEVFQLAKKISIIQHHLNYVKWSLVVLKWKYDEEIAQNLRDLGYHVPKMDEGTYFITNRNYAYDTALLEIETLADKKFPELSDLINEYDLIKLPE
ncbi:MAG: hypothetical protein ACTHM7_14160 [Ginsengibacter sp.]